METSNFFELTFNIPMPLPEAVAELAEAFRIEETSTYLQFPELKPTDQVTITELFPENDQHLAIIQVIKQPEQDTPAQGVTIYPEFIEGLDCYKPINLPTQLGNLTTEEEAELAQYFYGHTTGSARGRELAAIKKGSLTREEAAELKIALEKKFRDNPTINFWTWSQFQPQHIQDLWWRSVRV
jgi:hypothetical protein